MRKGVEIESGVTTASGKWW